MDSQMISCGASNTRLQISVEAPVVIAPVCGCHLCRVLHQRKTLMPRGNTWFCSSRRCLSVSGTEVPGQRHALHRHPGSRSEVVPCRPVLGQRTRRTPSVSARSHVAASTARRLAQERKSSAGAVEILGVPRFTIKNSRCTRGLQKTTRLGSRGARKNRRCTAQLPGVTNSARMGRGRSSQCSIRCSSRCSSRGTISQCTSSQCSMQHPEMDSLGTGQLLHSNLHHMLLRRQHSVKMHQEMWRRRRSWSNARIVGAASTLMPSRGIAAFARRSLARRGSSSTVLRTDLEIWRMLALSYKMRRRSRKR